MASRVKPKAAPTKGWNTRDPIAKMDPLYAIIMDNFFPSASDVGLRRGYREHTTGGMGGGVVETLLEWSGPTSRKLFGFANNKIYDCSTFNTTATDVTAGSAITSNRWQGANARGRLTIVNGADVPRNYNGSVWADTTFTGVGLTPENLIGIEQFKSRLYLIQKDSLTYWYSATNTISGALSAVDLSGIFHNGGHLVLISTWTRDSGDGPDDYLVFVSSTGEYLLYSGPDPSDSAWTIVGRFQMGAPLGRRASTLVGPELVLATQDGLVPLTAALTRGNVDNGQNSAISDAIQPTFSLAAQQYGANFGWEVLLYPLGPYLLVNIPITESLTSYQYVVNTITGAWCRFTGQNALCWSLFDSLPYFGTSNGKVMQADYGTSDGSSGGVVTTNGAAIVGDLKTAFDYFGASGQQKQFQMVRPLLQSNGPITVTLDFQLDFADNAIDSTVSSGTGTPWGSPWGSPWSDAMQVSSDWYSVDAGFGYAAALRLGVATKTQRIALSAYDTMFQPGGFI